MILWVLQYYGFYKIKNKKLFIYIAGVSSATRNKKVHFIPSLLKKLVIVVNSISRQKHIFSKKIALLE